MNSGRGRFNQAQGTSLRRLALTLACLLFLLHTVGEVFHWRAHISPVAVASASVCSPDSGLPALHNETLAAGSHENCPLCTLAGVAAVVLLAGFLLAVFGGQRVRRRIPLPLSAFVNEPGRRGPPRAPPAFA